MIVYPDIMMMILMLIVKNVTINVKPVVILLMDVTVVEVIGLITPVTALLDNMMMVLVKIVKIVTITVVFVLVLV